MIVLKSLIFQGVIVRTSLLSFSILKKIKNLKFNSFVSSEVSMVTTLIGSLLVIPIALSFGNTEPSNHEVSDRADTAIETSIKESTEAKEKITSDNNKSSSNSKSVSNSSSNVTTNISGNSTNSNTSIKIQSSFSSSNGSSTVGDENQSSSADQSSRQTIEKESGQSRVNYSVDVSGDSESEVRVRERGDKIKIDFRERSR